MTLSPNPQVVTEMDFPEAIRKVIQGKKIARFIWANLDFGYLKDGWLTINRDGKDFTWQVNDGDLNGTDWIVIE